MHEQIIGFFNTIHSSIHGFAVAFLNIFGIRGESTFLGNTAGEYVFAVVLFLLLLGVLKVVQLIVLRYLNMLALKTKTDLDDTFIKMFRSFNPPFYTFIALWFSLESLTISGFAEKVVNSILIIWVVYQVVVAFGILIEDIIFKKFVVDTDPTTKSALHVLTKLAKGVLWILGGIVLLSNLGFDVTGLMAGVGIGGIAIAFALQGILSDLFSSFSIYFDKPYQVGDFVVVGALAGTIEKIGIKSTRIRSLTGEELILSNQQMVSAEIQNYHDMQKRRIVFNFGIVYETPATKVRAIPGIIQEIIESTEDTQFDRAHFHKFGDSSLDFEVVYYATTGNYTKYMDAQQFINLSIFERFEQEGIEFAYPTQTVYQTNVKGVEG